MTLYIGHRFANSAGWQWRYRLVAAYALGEALRPDEHVHHVNGIIDDDRAKNLSVVAASYHGRLHARAVELAGARQSDGRFRKFDSAPEMAEYPLNRIGPVLSIRPIDPTTWTPRAETLPTP